MIKIQIKTGLKLIYLVINLVINRICTGFNLDLSIHISCFVLCGSHSPDSYNYIIKKVQLNQNLIGPFKANYFTEFI